MSIPNFLYVHVGSASADDVEKKVYKALAEHKIETRLAATIYKGKYENTNWGYLWVESLVGWRLLMGLNEDGSKREKKISDGGLTQDEIEHELAKAESELESSGEIDTSPPAPETPKKFASKTSWADIDDEEETSKQTEAEQKQAKLRASPQFKQKKAQLIASAATYTVESLPSLVQIGDWKFMPAGLKPGVKGTALQFKDSVPKWVDHRVIAAHFRLFGEPTVNFIRGGEPRVSITFKNPDITRGLSLMKKYMTFEAKGQKPIEVRTWLA